MSFCPLEEAELGSVASQEAKPPSSSALTSSSFCVQVNWANVFLMLKFSMFSLQLTTALIALFYRKCLSRC